MRLGRAEKTVLVLLIAALAVLCERMEKGREAPPESDGQSVRVASVADGDSVTLADGTQVRYLGIDTPERGEPFSREAREENRRLVGGREVTLRRGGPDASDRYGRRLALVHVREGTGNGEVSINAALLRAGLANVYISGPDAVDADVLQDLLAAQRAAIAERRGIWKRWLERAAASRPRFVSTRFRIHVEACPDARAGRPRPVESLERALKEGKSFCRTCRRMWDG